jgi:hypothetical protein
VVLLESNVDRLAVQFLDRDYNRRMGCKPHGEGFAELQGHAWFKGLDWESLKAQESPFVPDVGITIISPLLQSSHAFSPKKPTSMQRMNWKSYYWRIIL